MTEGLARQIDMLLNEDVEHPTQGFIIIIMEMRDGEVGGDTKVLSNIGDDIDTALGILRGTIRELQLHTPKGNA
jgi:hypothetical protein